MKWTLFTILALGLLRVVWPYYAILPELTSSLLAGSLYPWAWAFVLGLGLFALLHLTAIVWFVERSIQYICQKEG